MKKLLTIICALSLIMAFSMPAGAVDDIEDNQVGLSAFGGETVQAQDDITQIDDSGNFSGNLSGNSADDNSDNSVNVPVTIDDIASDNDNSIDDSYNQENGNTKVEVEDNNVDIASHNKAFSDNTLDDNSDDDFMSDNTYTDESKEDVAYNDGDAAWKGGEVDKSTDKSKEDVADNNGDAAWKGGEIDKSTETAEGDNVATKGGEITTVEMEDNQAAAAMGGFALAIEIEDIELNLAQTTSYSGIIQESEFDAGSLFSLAGDDGVDAFNQNCFKVEASVYSNTGITGANFTSGNFNNSANLNNVTMTVQY